MLVDYCMRVHIDTINMALSSLYLGMSVKNYIKMMYLMSLKIVFILSNRAYPDKMPPYAAFYLGIHCLPKYLFTGIQNQNNYMQAATMPI